MAHDPLVAARIYGVVRTRLASGAIPPGARVDAAALANDLQASATPVREALARLLGEGMLTFTARRGYFAPPLTRAGLNALYDWSAFMCDAAARQCGAVEGVAGLAPPVTVSAYPHYLNQIFDALGKSVSNPHVEAMFGAMSARLGPVRLAEGRILERSLEDAGRLAAALATGRGLRVQLRRHHERRRDAVVAIIGDALVRFANGDSDG